MMLASYAIDVGSTRPSKAAPRGAFGWARACAAAVGPDVLAGTTIISGGLREIRSGASRRST